LLRVCAAIRIQAYACGCQYRQHHEEPLDPVTVALMRLEPRIAQGITIDGDGLAFPASPTHDTPGVGLWMSFGSGLQRCGRG